MVPMIFWILGCGVGWSDTAPQLPFERLATQYDIHAFGPPACGGDREEGMFAAVGPELFDDGAACGRELSLSHDGGDTIVVEVNNLCPECDAEGLIDLQAQGAWPVFQDTIHDMYSTYGGDIPVTVTLLD